MSENNKGNNQQRGNTPSTGKDQKSNSVSTPSEPIKYDSSIPVPGSNVVTESYQPPVSKKQK